VCEAHFGNQAAAKQRAGTALQFGKGRDVEYAAAFALAAKTLAKCEVTKSEQLNLDSGQY